MCCGDKDARGGLVGAGGNTIRKTWWGVPASIGSSMGEFTGGTYRGVRQTGSLNIRGEEARGGEASGNEAADGGRVTKSCGGDGVEYTRTFGGGGARAEGRCWGVICVVVVIVVVDVDSFASSRMKRCSYDKVFFFVSFFSYLLSKSLMEQQQLVEWLESL